MKDSKVLYSGTDYDDFQFVVWQTELGLVVTTHGKLNLQSNLTIKDAETGDEIKDIDLRNVLMSVLPR